MMFLLSLICFLTEVHSEGTFPFISFNGQTLANHSLVDLEQYRFHSYFYGSMNIGCHTDLTTCCTNAQGPYRGYWYSPDGTQLSGIFESDNMRVNYVYSYGYHYYGQGEGLVSGIYRCDIPTNATHDEGDNSVRDTVYVGLYTNGGMQNNLSLLYASLCSSFRWYLHAHTVLCIVGQNFILICSRVFIRMVS